MMNNIKLLEYCKKNKEDFLDRNYMFKEKDPDLDLYKKRTREIKELLIAIKRVRGRKGNKKVLEQIFNDLQKAIKKYANYSEFGCFINACDSNIEEVKKNSNLLKKITFLYLEKRDLNDIVPSEWIQALIDEASSRRKGKAGENKLVNILKRKGFNEIDNIKDFQGFNKSVAKLSKAGDFSNKNIKKVLKISLGGKTQDKSLDLIIKKDKDLFFLEAKHLNTSGGGQNKQILELINIIKEKPSRKNCHFIAFLDGVYSNIILDAGNQEKNKKKKNKIQLQYNDIVEALEKNRENYWLNTKGFIKLFS